jgi:hypothetical protein
MKAYNINDFAALIGIDWAEKNMMSVSIKFTDPVTKSV